MARNNRLLSLSESIKGYHRVLDIGCDHGLVLKYALDHQYIHSAIASDIALKPLERAKKNLENYPVSFVCSDGFKEIHEPFDVVLIAGLGGHTIIDILKDAPNHPFDLVLMPHDRLERVRRYLSENYYGIISEKIIFDKHYYTIFHVNKSKMIISEKEVYTGKNLIMNEITCTHLLLQHEKYQTLALRADHEKALLFHTIATYYKEVLDECTSKSSTI
jgi:tRNA (adenine22-N1)-methyltransferase